MASTFETNDPDVIILSDDEDDNISPKPPITTPSHSQLPPIVSDENQNSNSKRRRSAAVLATKRCQEHLKKSDAQLKIDTDENSNTSMDCEVQQKPSINAKEAQNDVVKKQPLTNSASSNSRKPNSNTNGFNGKINKQDEEEDETLKKFNYDSEGNKKLFLKLPIEFPALSIKIVSNFKLINDFISDKYS